MPHSARQQGLHLILPRLRPSELPPARPELAHGDKLYTHLALKERAENGWVNAMLFNNAYLTGATRISGWIGNFCDRGLVLLLLAAHGAGRWLFATSGAKHETQVRLSALAALLHWGNALLFVILLITGISMHYSERARRRLASGLMS